MQNPRQIFERLKNFGTELLNPVQKPEVSTENQYQKNFNILFKKEPEYVQKLIEKSKLDKNFQNKEVDNFISKVILESEKN